MRLLLLFVISMMVACTTPEEQATRVGEEQVVREASAPPVATQRPVAAAIAQIDALRSGLAPYVEQQEQVDAETFAQVCKPVGLRLKQTASENGWMIRQVAVRYRNPAHAPDPQADAVFARFEAEAGLDSLWMRADHEGSSGWRYLRRITVEPACLACHGPKEARPAFVKANYPEDRAFGFQAGDLRGLYSVFVPDSVQVSEDGL